jgi:hypothetical protein
MARPSTRAELADYCLRALGAPVMEINIDDDQLEDRIDEALQYWQEYHSDAVVRTLLKHQITQDDLDDNKISNLPENILSVTRILSFNDTSSASMFSAKYQMFLNDVYGLRNPGGIINYEMTSQYISLVQNIITGHTAQLSYARHMDAIQFHGLLRDKTKVGDFIIIECYTSVDPVGYPDVYNDMALKELLTLLIKKQWGQNLSKFEGMQLPGGVTINGRQIYEEAVADLKELKERFDLFYSDPVDFFCG